MQNFGTQPTQPPVGIIKNLEDNLHDEVVPSQDLGIFVDPSSIPRPKNRLSRSQKKGCFNAQRLTSPDTAMPTEDSVSSAKNSLTTQTTPPSFVSLEKQNVHAQNTITMSEGSDGFVTPQKPSRLSRSKTRKVQNVKNSSEPESCSVSLDCSTPKQFFENNTLTTQTTPPPFVFLEKLTVHAQDNFVMSQDSDDMLTPKRTSKLSRSNNRRILNLKKPLILKVVASLRTHRHQCKVKVHPKV